MTGATQPPSKPEGWAASVRQFGVFLSVGLVCAVLDVGTMLGLMRMGIAPLVATSWGFVLGLVLNFVLHSRMTFKAGGNWDSLWRFLGVVTLNYGITVAFVAATTVWLDAPLTGKLVSLPVVALNGFWLSRCWVFR